MRGNVSKHHTPNPARSVRLQGALSLQLAVKAAAEIARLRRESRRPVTLSIKSQGGSIEAFKVLEAQITLARRAACIVTVARGSVRSAAAYLLVLGHYAYAKKGSRLVFHGVRYRDMAGRHFKKIKSEDALAMTLQLEAQNHRIAVVMAQRMVHRVACRFQQYQRSMDDLAMTARRKRSTRLAGFFRFIDDHLHGSGSKLIVKDAERGMADMLALSACCMRGRWSRDAAKIEMNILKALIARRMKAQPKGGRPFSGSFASETILDFRFFAYLASEDCLRCSMALVSTIGPAFLNEEQLAEYLRLKRAGSSPAADYLKKTVGLILPGLWHFTLSLCRRLMMRENRLRASDAYWLGLIDGVRGARLASAPLAKGRPGPVRRR